MIEFCRLQKKIKPSDLLYIVVFVFCANTLIAETELFVPQIYTSINYLIYITLLFISFINDIYFAKLRIIGFKLLVLVLGLLSLYTSGSNYMLVSILFVLASFKSDFQKVIKVFLAANIGCIVFIVILNITGLIEAVFTYREGSNVIRNSLGFSHVNVLANHLILIMISVIYLYYENLKYKHYIILLAILMFGYYITRTYTLAVMGVACILTLAFFRLMKNKRYYKWKYVFVVSPIVCLILSFLPVILFSDQQNNFLNTIFTNRIYYIRLFYQQYGLSIFGQRINLIGSSEALASHVAARILDNAYLHISIRYGVVILAVFLVGYVKAAWQSVKEKKDVILIIVFLISIWGIVETVFFRFEYNPYILLIAYAIKSVRKPIYGRGDITED